MTTLAISPVINQTRHSYLTALAISPVINQTRHSYVTTLENSPIVIKPVILIRQLSFDQLRILGIGMKLACNGGSFCGISLTKRLTPFTFEKTLRISLSCKLVPVQYRE